MNMFSKYTHRQFPLETHTHIICLNMKQELIKQGQREEISLCQGGQSK